MANDQILQKSREKFVCHSLMNKQSRNYMGVNTLTFAGRVWAWLAARGV